MSQIESVRRIAGLPALASPRQIAECEDSGMSEGEVRDLIANELLPAIPVGKRRKVRKVDLLRFLKEPRPCPVETPARAFGSSNGATPGTSHGQSADAIGSAALALVIGRTLKSSSRRSLEAEAPKEARVIRGKFS